MPINLDKILETEIKKRIMSNNEFKTFVEGDLLNINVCVQGVPFVFFREDRNSSAYIKTPPCGIDLEAYLYALAFMLIINSCIQDTIVRHDDDSLFAPGSKVIGTPRYT